MQLQIHGRLGNQMFQYATLKAFKIKNNIDGQLDICLENSNDKDLLSYFNITDYNNINKTFKQKFIYLLFKVYFKFLKFTISDNYNKIIKVQNKYKNGLNKKGLYFYFYGHTEFKYYNSIIQKFNI